MPTIPKPAKPWPAMPPSFRELAAQAAAQAGFAAFAPDACLINRYQPGARMSLHQDKDELDFGAPIVSVSLGLPAIFLFGGLKRSDKPQPVSAGAWRHRGVGRAGAAGVSRRRAAGRRRARLDGPAAHQSDVSQGALSARASVPHAIAAAFPPNRSRLCSAPRGPDMSDAELPADASAGANRTGIYLAILQLVFTLGWTTYVIYLPKLAAEGRDRAVGRDPDPDAGSGDLHHHRHRDGDRRRQDRALGRPARRVRGRVDRAVLRGLCRAAVRGRHRPRRAESGSSR